MDYVFSNFLSMVLVVVVGVIILAIWPKNSKDENPEEVESLQDSRTEQELPKVRHVPQVFWQLRAQGRGASVCNIVYRTDDILWDSEEKALNNVEKFKKEVTGSRVGRMDGIHRDFLEIYAQEVKLG